MRFKSALALGIAAAGLALAPPALAQKPLVVDDDHAQCANAQYTSIQAAVTAASSGSRILVCPGTYREQVTISTAAKNGLKLKAKGPRDRVILNGTGLPARMAGFWLQDVSGVLIQGFTVRGYHESDILLDRSQRNVIRHNVTTGSDHDGIQLRLASAQNLITHNLVINLPAANACGIQVRDPGSNGNVIRHNRVIDSHWGIRVGLGAANSVVVHNRTVMNRFFGILAFNGAPGTLVAHNHAKRNPTGVGIQGSTAVTLLRNHAVANTLDGIALLNGDDNVVLMNHSDENGRDGIRADPASTGNTIAGNQLRRNAEHDCHDDSVGSGTAGTANFWNGNHGRTENRPGLCHHKKDKKP
jgi:parallel beta-helix repeat protein